MALHLNPLTSGTLREGEGGAELTLRAFAPARSYRPFKVEQATHQEDFDLLLGWLRGAPVNTWQPSDPLLRAAALVTGILVPEQELASLPEGVVPELGTGRSAAEALWPGVSAVFYSRPIPPEGSQALADALEHRGYAELPAMLGTEALTALAGYYRALAEGGWTRFDRGQSGRRVINNDPAGSYVLTALTPLISALARVDLKPSYCFAAQYGGGDELERHTDRSQCEYTVSLFIDHQPGEGSEVCPWPLVIHAPGGDVAVRQPRGGGPVFRGRELPHSRPPLGEGESSQMLFLHYVHADFGDTLD